MKWSEAIADHKCRELMCSRFQRWVGFICFEMDIFRVATTNKSRSVTFCAKSSVRQISEGSVPTKSSGKLRGFGLKSPGNLMRLQMPIRRMVACRTYFFSWRGVRSAFMVNAVHLHQYRICTAFIFSTKKSPSWPLDYT